MKKGFTLIELLAVIILLGLIALIAYPTLNNVISKNKDKLYEKQINELERHANTWIMDHANTFELENGDSYLLSFEEMYNSGLLNVKEVKDPRNSENIKGCMVITRNNANYDIKYSEECKATYDCTFDGELVQGAEFIDGQYTYRYMQSALAGGWLNITNDGWGVKLTDPNATVPITAKLCTTINNKPIVSMAHMFYDSKSSSVDLSSFDTSNVVDMSRMFMNSEFTSLDLSKLDTSKVTDMKMMFYNNKATSIIFSDRFDTSNVTDMGYMFANVPVTNLDLGSFNTSKVQYMNSMFFGLKLTTLDLSNFDTSNVTSMGNMFADSELIDINLNSFNTSKVTYMSDMFANDKMESLDLSSFDTSIGPDMTGIFRNSSLKNLYVKNQNEVDRFSAITTNPNGLVITVK